MAKPLLSSLGRTVTCMISSQFGQPLRRKSIGVCMIEQRRQARKFFDRACGGIGAAGVEDAMVGPAVAVAVQLSPFDYVKELGAVITAR